MSSPARLHRERTLAAAAASNAPSGDVAAPPPSEGPAATAYEQMLMQLAEDRRRLHDIQSIERKIALKVDLAPAYDAWVDGALAEAEASGRAVQDEVVATMMTWAIDIQNWPRALQLGRHVLRFNLALPERFKRDAATLLVEETSEAAIKALSKAGGTFPREILAEIEALTADRDMPDEVRAKLFKALGLALVAAADAATDDDTNQIAGFASACRAEALAAFQRAVELNPAAGVKKNIEALERAIRKAGAES
jgi:hypothetical protein